MNKKISVGDKVKTIPFYKKEKPVRGTVISIKEYWEGWGEGPCGGGVITVKLENGVEEHFVHHKWDKWLKIQK